MDKLIELAERCEKAGGPDRELDNDICEAVKAYPDDWKTVLPGYSLGYFIAWSECAQAYTASIDAALTLVPEGWDWTAGISTVEGFPPGYADVSPQAQPFPVELDICVEAATPALALCAAALRARSSTILVGDAQ